MSKIYARPIVMATLALTLAAGTAGCQTLSDLDPTGLIGGDDNASASTTQFPPDSPQQAAQDANTTTPDLASLPARPAQPDATAQATATQQVNAAGTQAQDSADALRAGTDAAAPPPPAAADAAAAKQALAAANNAPPTASPPSASADAPPTAGSEQSAPPTASAAPPTASAAANPNAAVPSQQMASAAPPTAPMTAAPEAPPSAAAPTAEAPAPAAVATAPLPPPPPGAEPAVPAVPAAPGSQIAMINPSDSQLGFKPSAAPPLNPSVSQWVSPPVLAHYRETAAMAGSAGTAEPAVAAVPATPTRRRGRAGAVAPPLPGEVVANMDAVPGTAMGRAAAMNGGMAPTAIIYFPGDTTRLSKSALAQVQSAVAAFQAGGGSGTVKVVGHASSRTANMPVERHLEVIFQKSQARADAVAQALIKAGVPADKVQIEAVGDSQPIYYESMPKGEDGNRRAEIFVQS